MSLQTLSVIWSLIHVAVIYSTLFENRFSKKKAHILALCFIGPVFAFNLYYFVRFGPERMGQAVFLICTVPTILFSYFTATHRDGRFLFTVCFIAAIAYEITAVTHIIDFYLSRDSHVVMFVLRLITYPLLEWLLAKRLREPYREIQRSVRTGWWLFAVTAVLLDMLLVFICNFPTIITGRPEYLPGALLTMLLVPLIYWCIYLVLRQQQAIFEAREQKQLLRLQSRSLQQNIKQVSDTAEQLSILRHDQRHYIGTLRAMLERQDTEAALTYLDAADETLSGAAPRHWCLNPTLDAVFASYFSAAEAEGIRIEAALDIPAELDVDVTELSTVFANALENAIHAVKELPEGERFIRCKCIRHPQLMFCVSNPYTGEVRFDRKGFPVASKAEHGLGTRSITAYCEKHGAVCSYKTENGIFTITVVQP